MVMFKKSHGSTLNMEPFFLIRFERRTQKQHKNHYIIRITRVITHETSSCVQHVFNSNPPRTRYHSPDNFIDFHGLMWFSLFARVGKFAASLFLLILFFLFIFCFHCLFSWFHQQYYSLFEHLYH